MNGKILFLGGSPCSGKSTVAEHIVREYGAYYFKVDDFLDGYLRSAAQREASVCQQCLAMTPDEIWLREPLEQCREEFLIYDEIAGLIFEDIQKIESERIVAEGAAFTPRVMDRYGYGNYICLVPEPDFQISHYRERPWVSHVLEGCSDKVRAFDQWMQRDILFARQVKRDCDDRHIPCLVNDGSRSEEEIYQLIMSYGIFE